LRHVAPLLVLLAVPACSRDSTRPTGTTEPMPAVSSSPISDPFLPASEAPSASAPPENAGPAPKSSVTLEDPGHEPRRELRYAWRADQKEQMAITLRTTVSAESGGAHQDVPFPALHIVVAIDPKSVSPSGDLRYAWRVTSAETDADASAPAQVAQGWAAQLVPIAHLSGTGTVTSRGLSRGVTLDALPAPDAGGQEMVDQVRQMLRDACAPMPEEAVGKGAKWQRVSTLDAKNGHATQTDTYTLTDLQGDKGALDDTLAQTASPQALPTPVGAGPSMTARVDSLLTSGTAKIRFALARIVADFQFDGTTAMALTAPTNRMNMVMRLGIAVQGSTR
jgi:hypothetical protein